jgi:hypothetical protein
MGNVNAVYDPQQQSAMSFLPVDVLIKLTSYLDVGGFIDLCATCKYYNYQLIGSVSYDVMFN